ncbi:MAG: DUF4177 domain-containing protein [Holophagales bacterium]|jgi:hypothetical protein|nr:DUF4177 domain-containing protein [Holophagales bacterium]
MKKTFFALAAAVILTTGVSAQEAETPKTVSSASKQKWEYMFVDGQFTKKVKLLSSRIEDDMKAANDLGAEGWEMIATLPKTEPSGKPTVYFYYIYKRPVE